MKLVLTISDPGNAKARTVSRMLETGSLTIGRGESADWSIADPDRVLSKLHCRIEARSGRFILTDTSTNGVFINGSTQPLGEGKTAILNDGDELQLGSVRIAVAVDMEAPSRRTSTIPQEAVSFVDMLGRAYNKGAQFLDEPRPAAQAGVAPDWIAPALPDTVPVQNQAFTPPPVRATPKSPAAPPTTIPDDWLATPSAAPAVTAAAKPAPMIAEPIMPEPTAAVRINGDKTLDRMSGPLSPDSTAAEITERHHRALITGLASLAAGDASLRAALGCAVDPAGPNAVLALTDSKALRAALASGDSSAVTKVLAAGLAHQSALASAIHAAVEGLPGPAAFDFKAALAATYRRVFEARMRPMPGRKE